MEVIFSLAVGILFGLGVFQMLRRDLIKAAMGFSILFTGVNLFILSVGAYDGVVPAYTDLAEEAQVSDPLVQALILTAIVIGFGLIVFSLSLLMKAREALATDDIDALQTTDRLS
jgi:multicomponent Na+:H+ antiporter subunit C